MTTLLLLSVDALEIAVRCRIFSSLPISVANLQRTSMTYKVVLFYSGVPHTSLVHRNALKLIACFEYREYLGLPF